MFFCSTACTGSWWPGPVTVRSWWPDFLGLCRPDSGAQERPEQGGFRHRWMFFPSKEHMAIMHLPLTEKIKNETKILGLAHIFWF